MVFVFSKFIVGRHRLGGFDSTSPVALSGSQVDYGPGYWSDFGGCQWGTQQRSAQLICAMELIVVPSWSQLVRPEKNLVEGVDKKRWFEAFEALEIPRSCWKFRDRFHMCFAWPDSLGTGWVHFVTRNGEFSHELGSRGLSVWRIQSTAWRLRLLDKPWLNMVRYVYVEDHVIIIEYDIWHDISGQKYTLQTNYLVGACSIVYCCFFFRIDWTFHAMMCLCLFVAGSKPEDYITRYPPFFQGWHRFSQQGDHNVFALPRLHSDALSLWRLLDHSRDRHSMSACSVSPNAPWRLWTVFRATSICCTTMNATRSGITGWMEGDHHRSQICSDVFL